VPELQRSDLEAHLRAASLRVRMPVRDAGYRTPRGSPRRRRQASSDGRSADRERRAAKRRTWCTNASSDVCCASDSVAPYTSVTSGMSYWPRRSRSALRRHRPLTDRHRWPSAWSSLPRPATPSVVLANTATLDGGARHSPWTRQSRSRSPGRHPRYPAAPLGSSLDEGTHGLHQRLDGQLDSPMVDLLHGEGTVRREFPGKWSARSASTPLARTTASSRRT